MEEEPKSPIFDQDFYGVNLRTARQKAGFNRAEDFCNCVQTWTGVKINKEALYRIEKGVQPPTVEQLIAFSLILNHGKGIADVLNKTELHRSVTPYAEFFAKQESKGLTSIPAYNGYWVVEDPNSEELSYGDLIEDSQNGSQYIDSYYLDKAKAEEKLNMLLAQQVARDMDAQQEANKIEEQEELVSVVDEDIPF